MSRQEINLGTAPTGAGGDTTRSTGVKINAMTTELYGKTDNLRSAAYAAITGTVSQSGGLPTGALMESGVNGAGQYWRFAGGLQVCINEFTANLAVNGSANGMFYTSTAFAMPAAFASGSTPQFSFSARLPGAIVWGEFSSWNGAVAEMFIISGSSTSAANIIVKMIAVGRWFL